MASTRRPPHVFAREVGKRTGKFRWYVGKGKGRDRLRDSTGIAAIGTGGGSEALWKLEPEKTRQAVVAEQRVIENRWAKGGDRKKDIKVRTYWEQLKAHKATFCGDDYRMVRFLDQWGHKLLVEVKKSHCQAYLDSRGEDGDGAAPGTVNRERGTIQSFFERAVGDELLESNPWVGIKNAHKTAVNERTISYEEEDEIKAAMTPQFQRWYDFVVNTGVRIAEAREVSFVVRPCVGTVLDNGQERKCTRMHDVFFKDGVWQLHVRGKAIDPKTGETHHVAKYGKCRDVILYPEALDALLEQLFTTGVLWHAEQSNYRDVCNRARATVNAQRALKGLLEMETFSPHALRHTFGSRYIINGGSMSALSKLMGHANEGITAKQYVHLKVSNVMEMSRRVCLGRVGLPNYHPTAENGQNP